jgi:hypothetical protein
MTIVLDYTLMFVSQFPLLIKVHQSLCSCYHLKPSLYMAETQMPPKIVKNHQHHPILHPLILKLHQNPPVFHQTSSIFIMFHDFSSCFLHFPTISPPFSPPPGTATPPRSPFFGPGAVELRARHEAVAVTVHAAPQTHGPSLQVLASRVVSWITNDD